MHQGGGGECKVLGLWVCYLGEGGPQVDTITFSGVLRYMLQPPSCLLQDDLPRLLPETGLEKLNDLSNFKLSLGTNLTQIDNTFFKSMPSLTTLDLSGSSIQNISMAIAQLSGLRTLAGARAGGHPAAAAS
jgi:hypothetical protein